MLVVDNVDDADDSTIDATAVPDPVALPDSRQGRLARRFDTGKVGRKLFDAAWPKLAALALVVLLWQVVVWWGYKPRVIKPPREVWSTAVDLWRDGVIPETIRNTMVRIGWGFALSLVIGVATGALVSSSKVVRTAIGSMITGMQTMPSIAWFPFAIALFARSEGAIRFVIVLGAAPAIANGLITGVDQISPLLLRAGRMLGARGIKSYQHVVLPATLPSFIGGLKQGWAFAWRSLLAGELLVMIARKPSLGSQLQQYRDLSKYAEMTVMMLVIFMIGVLVDAIFFGTLDRAIRRRWGLLTD